jgi:hypothetical protein
MRSSEGLARRQNNREPIKHTSPSVAFQHGPEPPSAGTGASRSQAAADPKRAEAERKAIADAQKIVAIWNARQAGGVRYGSTDHRRRDRGGLTLADVLLPRVRVARLGRPAHA